MTPCRVACPRCAYPSEVRTCPRCDTEVLPRPLRLEGTRTEAKKADVFIGGFCEVVDDCGGVIDTRTAAAVLTDNGTVTFVGCQCTGCDQTFTIECSEP